MQVHTKQGQYNKASIAKASFLAVSIVFILSGCAVNPGDSVDAIQNEIASIAPTPLTLIQGDKQQRSVDRGSMLYCCSL